MILVLSIATVPATSVAAESTSPMVTASEECPNSLHACVVWVIDFCRINIPFCPLMAETI